MVDFRRVITALAVLALFTGMAVAQVGGTGQSQLTCATNVTVTPQLRGEGYTEQTGDITITCSGGAVITPGNTVPLVNFAISYNTLVTSRLIPTGASNNISEALLLIDEPGSGLPGYGPSLAQKLCTTPVTGCNATAGAGGTTIGSDGTYAPNVYQGLVTGNTVTFFGVPVNPPTTTGSRVFRITNVRVNAVPLAGGSASGASPVQASIATSTGISISNSAPNVGFVYTSLSTSASSAANLNQCSSQTKTSINTLTFTETFGTAFKTRVFAQSNVLYAGQLAPLPTNPNPGNQATPGLIYNSESNFVFPVPNGTAGLTDWGTRLKATFNNVPSGARIFVSTANVNNNAFPVTPPTPPGGNIGNNTTSGTYVGYALLVNGETSSDGTGAASGFLPTVSATDNGPGSSGNVPIAEVPIAGGTGTAVWEVINTNPNTNESLKFAVYITYTASVATNSPAAGNVTANLSYAPTATSGAASSTLGLPRFAGDSSAARPLATISVCRTILLYPYVTNQAGFDTGLEIANTSQDPFTTGGNATGAQAGSCKLTWYGGTTAAPTTPPGPSDTGNIPAGTVWVNTAGIIAPTFQGYMFAVCNFQYAHGFAFISDVGARNLAMGYLAVVIPDPGTGSRTATPMGCAGITGGGTSCNSTGEQDGH